MAHTLQLAGNINAGYVLQVYIQHKACRFVQTGAVQKICDLIKASSVIAANTQRTLDCAQHGHVIVQNHYTLARGHIAIHLIARVSCDTCKLQSQLAQRCHSGLAGARQNLATTSQAAILTPVVVWPTPPRAQLLSRLI